MSGRLSLYLVLGCNGSRDQEFVYCHSTDNIILDFDKLDDDTYYKVIDFLDNACDLFDGPINDYNKVTNTISLLFKTFKVIEQINLYKIQKYLKMHHNCGLYLILLLKENYNE